MSLEKWVEYGWLRREPTSTGEIKDLLGIVDRSLADSTVEAVSTDLRFIAAFNAALCIATTALSNSLPLSLRAGASREIGSAPYACDHHSLSQEKLLFGFIFERKEFRHSGGRRASPRSMSRWARKLLNFLTPPG